MTQVQCRRTKRIETPPRVVCIAMSFALAGCIAVAFALPAMAEIRGSAHDFTSEGWSGGELCAVCHMPHIRTGSDGAVPLWNHEISSASYTLYASSTLTQTPEQPDSTSISRLCLSCHDGTIALDSFGGNQGGSYIAERSSLGRDLSNDHPIGVRRIDRGNGGTAVPGNGVKFYDGKVECPSCHDVHNDNVSDEKLLRVARTGSELCFQCHDK